MSEQKLYKVVFLQEDKVYEIYASYITEESLMGFIEVEALVFDEGLSQNTDPAEVKLRQEFAGVKRTYIPMHHILRIDEVERKGVATIKVVETKAGNVHPFPDRQQVDPEY